VYYEKLNYTHDSSELEMKKEKVWSIKMWRQKLISPNHLIGCICFINFFLALSLKTRQLTWILYVAFFFAGGHKKSSRELSNKLWVCGLCDAVIGLNVSLLLSDKWALKLDALQNWVETELLRAVVKTKPYIISHLPTLLSIRDGNSAGVLFIPNVFPCVT